MQPEDVKPFTILYVIATGEPVFTYGPANSDNGMVAVKRYIQGNDGIRNEDAEYHSYELETRDQQAERVVADFQANEARARKAAEASVQSQTRTVVIPKAN
jgi:hypothetical protein